MYNNIPPDQPTMPNPALQPRTKATRLSQSTVRHSIPVPPRLNQARKNYVPPMPSSIKKKRNNRWIWVMLIGGVGTIISIGGAIVLGLMLIYGNGILPAVSVSGLSLGGLSQQEAVNLLNTEWDTIVLRDGVKPWDVDPDTLGITMDAQATAKRAYALGRTSGNPLNALIGGVDVSPIVTINDDVAYVAFQDIAEKVNIPPVDAGVGFENGTAVATPPQNGFSLDVSATIQQFALSIQAGITQGEIQLVMVEIAPAISDTSAVVAQAQALLSNPLDIQVYDPVTGDAVYWSVMPSEWSQWLTVTADNTSAIGLALNANPDSVRAFLTQQANTALDSTRTLDFDAGIESIVGAIQDGNLSTGFVRVKHQERIHIVQLGESITSIAWDYGIPYLYIQNLNAGIGSVSVGQQIKIPPADVFLSKAVNPNKRVIVSISNQTVKVYENNQLKWDWVGSTGIPDSPTWTGVYQILSHVDNAYAANWDLHMPNFMGVYQPVPGADFTNGFHGFPTRGGGQLLWENSLGRKVTYGCILLSNTNIQQLYSWAETGVVVEIQG
jgi:lipoprotein-anchoring transpeptidase ErfK/SrfK